MGRGAPEKKRNRCCEAVRRGNAPPTAGFGAGVQAEEEEWGAWFSNYLLFLSIQPRWMDPGITSHRLRAYAACPAHLEHVLVSRDALRAGTVWARLWDGPP